MTDQQAQQQPRKTIKLKPISKAPGASFGFSAPAPAPMSPQSAPTIQAESFGEAPTVKLSPQSIMKPQLMPEQGQPAPDATHTGTQPLKKVPTTSTRPGSLIPEGADNNMSFSGDQTLVTPSMPTSVGQEMPQVPGSGDDESTQKIATAAKAVARPQQQTIKLRPSTISAPAAAAPQAAQTIKLGAMTQAATPTPTPNPMTITGGATIKLVPTMATETAAIKPFGATIKLSPTQQTPAPETLKPGSPTIKLTAGSQTTKAEFTAPVSPGARTIQLSPEAQTQAEGADEAHPHKTKLVIKKPEGASMSGMHEGQLSPGGADSQDKQDEHAEPSMVFTLVAILTMVIAGYFFFMSAAQYANHWMGKSIPIPGITNSVK
ncbi:MAG: hypothetical protein A2020_06525 [Lentisphaerae bacterium GWF2_45_14]|nr:MAG: hypothetical protein A2020_06525 [Lentisphaerae bacterium GWF2_45_14]